MAKITFKLMGASQIVALRYYAQGYLFMGKYSLPIFRSDGTLQAPHKAGRNIGNKNVYQMYQSSVGTKYWPRQLYIHHLLHADDQVVTKSVYKRFEQVTG